MNQSTAGRWIGIIFCGYWQLKPHPRAAVGKQWQGPALRSFDDLPGSRDAVGINLTRWPDLWWICSPCTVWLNHLPSSWVRIYYGGSPLRFPYLWRHIFILQLRDLLLNLALDCIGHWSWPAKLLCCFWVNMDFSHNVAGNSHLLQKHLCKTSSSDGGLLLSTQQIACQLSWIFCS